MNLTKHLKNTADLTVTPEILNLSTENGKKRATKLLASHKIHFINNNYREQLQELFAAKNPKIFYDKNFNEEFGNYYRKLTKNVPETNLGAWIYYSWSSALVHTLDEADFYTLRTARNKNLITKEEQKKFYNARVGIAGLSIGSSVAAALTLQGGAKNIRLADFDSLALSNTNRIYAGIANLSLPKVIITARQIYELNPYAKIEIFPHGINEKNIKKFAGGLDVLVDEMDSLATKLMLRVEAKKQKIPVVMGADNGEMAVVDIERYDKNKPINFFNGRLGKININDLRGLTKFETGRTIAKLIGLENHTERMLFSLREMGKTIISWPQLGGTAMLNGAAVAYCLRKIICNQPLKENRAIISLDEALQADYFSKKNAELKKKTISEFKKSFNL